MGSELQIFIKESFERLARISEGLEGLCSAEETREELVNDLFRETHNMKGAANLVGARFIEQMAHCLEGILDQIRSGQEIPDAELVGFLEAGYRRIDELLSCPHMLPLVDASREVAVIEWHLRERKSG